MKGLIPNEVARCQPASLQKKVLHNLVDVFFLYFVRTHHDYVFRRVFESVRANFFFRKYKQKIVLLVI